MEEGLCINEMSAQFEVLQEQNVENCNEIFQIESDDEQKEKLVTVEWDGMPLTVSLFTAEQIFCEEKWKMFFKQLSQITKKIRSMHDLEEHLINASSQSFFQNSNQQRHMRIMNLINLGTRSSIIMLSDSQPLLRKQYWNALLDAYELNFSVDCCCWKGFEERLMIQKHIQSSIRLDQNQANEECFTWRSHAEELAMQNDGEKDIKNLVCSLQKIELRYDILFGKKCEQPQPIFLSFSEISTQDIFVKYNFECEHKNAWMEWTRTCCLHYALEDTQVGLTKGMQYVCLAVLMHPSCEFDPATATNIFLHLMQGLEFRLLYVPGSPRFFREVGEVMKALAEEEPEVAEHLQRLAVDQNMLFVSMYKTLLLHQVEQLEVARKIVELLLLYGIEIIGKLLVKLISKQKELLLAFNDGELLGIYIVRHLLNHYFIPTPNHSIQQLFRNLFVFT